MRLSARILVFVVRVPGHWEVIFSPAVGNGVLADPSVSLKLVKRDSVCAFILQQSLNRIKIMKKRKSYRNQITSTLFDVAWVAELGVYDSLISHVLIVVFEWRLSSK